MLVQNRRAVFACSIIFLCCAEPPFSFADETPKSDSAAKPETVTKPSAPPELIERERWLFDRVEKLEQRVAELEGKQTPAVTPAATEVAAPAPGASAASASAVNPGPAPSAALSTTARAFPPSVAVSFTPATATNAASAAGAPPLEFRHSRQVLERRANSKQNGRREI